MSPRLCRPSFWLLLSLPSKTTRSFPNRLPAGSRWGSCSAQLPPHPASLSTRAASAASLCRLRVDCGHVPPRLLPLARDAARPPLSSSLSLSLFVCLSLFLFLSVSPIALIRVAVAVAAAAAQRSRRPPWPQAWRPPLPPCPRCLRGRLRRSLLAPLIFSPSPPRPCSRSVHAGGPQGQLAQSGQRLRLCGGGGGGRAGGGSQDWPAQGRAGQTSSRWTASRCSGMCPRC